jgi:hypothetical protein
MGLSEAAATLQCEKHSRMPPHERMLIKGIFSQPPEQHTKMKTHSKSNEKMQK